MARPRVSRSTIHWLGVALVVAMAVGAGGLLATRSTPPTFGAGWLEERPLDLSDEYFLFDLGVTDVDGDGHLDLYTTNHNGRQSLRLGDGTLDFGADALTALSLDQEPTIPGSEDEGEPPDRAGLAFYRLRNDLLLRFRPTTGSPRTVMLRFFSNVEHAVEVGDADVRTTAGTDADGRPTTTVMVDADGVATVRLKPELRGLPVEIELPAGGAHLTTFGPQGFLVPANRFTVRLLDRHAMAWSDVDGDGRTDVFIARGGLKDRIDEFPGIVDDELLLAGTDAPFRPASATGLEKGTCRGRRATWVDIDLDGDLDLHVTCAEDPPQLWRRDDGQHFTDVSDRLAIDDLSSDAFVWHDLDGDRVPELISAVGTGITVLEARPDRTYASRQRLDLDLPRGLAEAHLGDLDGDGDADLLFPSPAGTVVAWVGADGALEAQPATTVGLPEQAVAARLVDVDGDGRLDVHVVPGGVWRQTVEGRFEASAILRDVVPDDATGARATWFDADDDGDRDVVLAWTTRGDKDWSASLYEQVGGPAGTVGIDLVGPPENREAVGAVVEARLDGVDQRHWIGESEGARFSDGHRRIYVGTGGGTINGLTVTWPDGTTQPVTGAGPVRRAAHPDAVPSP